jgi:hypothetical protein
LHPRSADEDDRLPAQGAPAFVSKGKAIGLHGFGLSDQQLTPGGKQSETGGYPKRAVTETGFQQAFHTDFV